MRPPRARDGVLTPQVVFCARDREHQRRTEGEGRDEASAPSKAAMDGQCTHSCAILSEGESIGVARLSEQQTKGRDVPERE